MAHEEGIDMRTFQVDLEGGASVKVEGAGDQGPHLLMLHAGVADRHMWDRQWQWLQHAYRVVRWDWRGFGDTAHVPGSFSYADDMITIMDHLSIPSAIVMGSSFAGATALQVAIEHPTRVDRLVLVGSGIPGYEASNPPEVDELFREADQALDRGDTKKFLDLMEQLWLVGPARQASDVEPSYLSRAGELLMQIDRPDNGARSRGTHGSILDALPKLTVPSLVVVGDQDVPDTVSAAHYLAQTLPNARLETIEGAAHLPNLERPRYFDAILSEWLAATGSPTVPS